MDKEIKTAEQILDNNGDWNEYDKNIILEAMEEYALQFKSPIVLPSDEEIEKWCKKTTTDDEKGDYYSAGKLVGVKWLREKIQNQLKL